jgi:hypothetical protein
MFEFDMVGLFSCTFYNALIIKQTARPSTIEIENHTSINKWRPTPRRPPSLFFWSKSDVFLCVLLVNRLIVPRIIQSYPVGLIIERRQLRFKILPLCTKLDTSEKVESKAIHLFMFSGCELEVRSSQLDLSLVNKFMYLYLCISITEAFP